MLDDAELVTLLRDRESDRVERKASASDRNALRRTISAFANDLPGHGKPGVVFIGVDDDGRCVGITISDHLLRQLGELRSDGKIHPFPTMAVQERVLDGCRLAVIFVQPSDNPPVRFEGRSFVRVGPTTRLATPEEERRLVEKRRWVNLPFDQRGVPGATLDDLDLRRFEIEYLPAMVPPDVLAANERSRDDQLRALRLVTREGHPTALAILALGKDPRAHLPGAYVQFVRLRGRELSGPIQDQHEIGGTLLDQFRRLDEVLKLNIGTETDIEAGPSVTRPDYPIVALQELARNALIHRNYEASTTPVRLIWYVDRIEITSPGGPFGEVTTDNFGQPNVVSYRNPGIAELASRLNYAQRFGTGIARARAELARNGNPPPEFVAQPTLVTVTIRRRS